MSSIKYYSYGQAVDGTQHSSAVETRAENLIQDSEVDKTVCFPRNNSWATMRSSGYRITTENAEFQTPYPIYRIKRILLKLPDFKVTLSTGAGTYDTNVSEYKNANGKSLLLEFDITRYVLRADEWNILPISDRDSSGPDYLDGLYKDNTFYWEEGQDKICLSGLIYEVAGDDPVYIRLIKTIFCNEGEDFTLNKDGVDWHLSGLGRTGSNFSTDPREWLFRIEYVPLTSATKLRARKAEKTNVEYIQPFNQRAEYNAVSAFGKSMYLTAQKTGVPAICVVKNYKRLADIPPLGSLVRYNGKKYRLVVNSYHWTNTVQVQVTHTLSENWTYKSNFVSIDQKYRNYEIPQDLLWRNLYFEDYVVISKNEPSYSSSAYSAGRSKFPASAISTAFYANVQANGINTFSWFKSAWEGVTLPLSAYGMANSLVFSCSFKDNVSAGIRAVGGRKYVQEEAFYGEEDGTLETARMVLSVGRGVFEYNDGVLNPFDIEDSLWDSIGVLNSVRWYYPAITSVEVDSGNVYLINYPVNPIYENMFYVDKKPGEALKFTYQLHFVPHDSDIVVGEALTSKHPCVKATEDTGARQMRFYGKRIREGDNKETSSCIVILQVTDSGKAYALESGTHDNGVEFFKIVLGESAKEYLEGDGVVSWAITDGEGNILIACNDITCTTLVFEMRHKR